MAIHAWSKEHGDDARIVLLHDNQGKVLVLLPGNHLLNLVSVWQETGRHLQPAKDADVVRFFSQPQLHQEEGLRKLFTLPVLVDPAFSQHEAVAVYEPHSQWYFSVQRSWYLATMQTSSISLSLAEIDRVQPGGSDEQVISQAVERFTALRIRQRLEDTLGLPGLAPSVQKLIALRTDPVAGVDRLVPIVKVDPSLSAQVMSWAVSPYYAAPGTIQSIDDAIIRVLGFDLVVNLALGVAMGKTLTLPDHVLSGQRGYWRQAVYMATLTERLAKQMPAYIRPKPGLAYLTGLLSNFGYVVLAHLFPPHFSLINRYTEANPHLPLDYIEKHLLHVTREQVGAWLMESWSLPEEVYSAVRYMNEPCHPKANYFAKVAYLANRSLRQSQDAEGPIEPLDERVLLETELGLEQLHEQVRLLHEDQAALAELTAVLCGKRN